MCNLEPLIYTAGPQTALIKTSPTKDVRVVVGGSMFAIPLVDRVDKLSLRLRTVTVRTRGRTINGAAVHVTSSCQVKIQGPDAGSHTGYPGATPAGDDYDMDYASVRLAAQHFLGKRDKQVAETIQHTIAGHQRSAIGAFTVEGLYREGERFSERVLHSCYNDMRNMGLSIVSYTVAEITDDPGYTGAPGAK